MAEQDTKEGLERIIRLQQQQLAALQEQLGELRARLAEMIEEKERALRGMQAAAAQQVAVHEGSVLPEDEKSKLIGSALEEARVNLEQKRVKFLEEVRNSPRVVINNFYPEAILLSVNGVSVLIPPGAHEVPSPFLSVWEAFIEDNRIAREREQAIRGEQDGGVLNQWLHDGKFMPTPNVLVR